MLAGKPRPAPAQGMSPSYRLFRRCVIALGRMFFGFEAVGEEKVPREGALVVASNHARYLDPILVCMAVPRRLQWMAKKELFTGPLDRFFALLGAFPVDRKKGGRAALRTALALLANGWALGIFPEGTHRTGPEADRAAKSGVAMLAARGNAPVLPVFVGQIPTPLQRLKGKKLRVAIGAPIYTYNTTERRRAYGEVSAEVLREIYAMSDEVGDVKGGGAA
jgi:1-acyl-sn-glycerol-3-phosphate acyltransferase